MKLKQIALALSVLALTSCSPSEATSSIVEDIRDLVCYKEAVNPGAEPSEAPLLYSAPTFANHLRDLSGRFTAGVLAEEELDKNQCLSPLSFYGAMAMLVGATKGQAMEDVLAYFGMSEEEVVEYTKVLLRQTNREDKDYEGKVASRRETDNAIFFQVNVPYVQAGLDLLAERYYASSYGLDFINNREAANKALEAYVARKTHDLIQPKFDYGPLTRFLLMNTLYHKSLWTFDMEQKEKEELFHPSVGDDQEIRYLYTPYLEGKVNDHGHFRSYRIPMTGSSELRILLPNAGKSVRDLTAEDWTNVASETYDYGDDKTGYETRVTFPGFTIESKYDLSDYVAAAGMESLFTGPDFSPITEQDVAVSSIIQMTKIIADLKGVEGAAVTIIEVKETAVINERKIEREDFFVDRAFGYEVLDMRTGSLLFSGLVNSAK